MTQTEPDGPYVYQPYGSVTDPKYAAVGRLWAVSGISPLTQIKGLTREEAEAIVTLLRDGTNLLKDCALLIYRLSGKRCRDPEYAKKARDFLKQHQMSGPGSILRGQDSSP